jgi:putative ABC transport system ATP-binding protein
MTRHPMIELKRLSKAYRQGSQVLPVLRGIDLVIGRGAFCGHHGAIGFG